MTSSYFIFGLVATNHRASFLFRIWPQMSDLWIRRHWWILEVIISYQSRIPRFFVYASDVKCYVNQARRKVIFEIAVVEKRVFWSKLLGRDSMDRGGIVRVTNKSMHAKRCAQLQYNFFAMCTVLFLSLLNIFMSCASLDLFTHCQITEDCLAWNFLLNQHQDIIILWALNWHSLWEKK